MKSASDCINTGEPAAAPVGGLQRLRAELSPQVGNMKLLLCQLVRTRPAFGHNINHVNIFPKILAVSALGLPLATKVTKLDRLRNDQIFCIPRKPSFIHLFYL